MNIEIVALLIVFSFHINYFVSRRSEEARGKTGVWVPMQVSSSFNKQKGQQAKTKQYLKMGHRRWQCSAGVPSAKTECNRNTVRITYIDECG